MEFDQERLIQNVANTLQNMFGEQISRDVLVAVAENCSGDLNLSADTVMNIISDGNITSQENASNTTSDPSSAITTTNQTQLHDSPMFSYAAASSSTGAVPKQTQHLAKLESKPNFGMWTEQVRRIMHHHNVGSRVLILMRGAPGSGKSYKARQILEMIVGDNYDNHIFSTDDFFLVQGVYQFNKYKLSDYHYLNQSKARKAMIAGVSPIIIDNTNIELWEMEPYVRSGVENGYIIEVVEPDTPWARKANQLARRNIHNVPIYNIKRMLDSMEVSVSGEFLIKHFRLSYPKEMVPPVLRKIPTVMSTEIPVSQKYESTDQACASSLINTNNISITDDIPVPNIHQQTESDIMTAPEEELNESKEIEEKYIEIAKKLELLEQVEQEWENGENWDEDSRKRENSTLSRVKSESIVAPKPQRKLDAKEVSQNESLMNTVDNCEDWTRLAMFMPPWQEPNEPQTSKPLKLTDIDVKSTSTCMEIGDCDIYSTQNIDKVVTATPRNINWDHISFDREKIPERRMLDKSSMTNEEILSQSYRCKNQEKHFIAFRKLFKNVAKSALRDIFDKCCGDVNWAVSIVLDGMTNNHLETAEDEDFSDVEEEIQEPCDCLAAYNIIPDNSLPVNEDIKENSVPAQSTILTPKKSKKDFKTTTLTKYLAENVVIADNHYSQHCLKIRKMRRGETDDGEDISGPLIPSDTLEKAAALDCCMSDVAGSLNIASAIDTEQRQACSLENVTNENCKDEDNYAEIDDISESDEVEKFVTVSIGNDFVTQLDNMFGRNNIKYPKEVKPKINVPMSLLNEINALWIESVMYQMDEEQTTMMIQQDEEFARQLEVKEAELASAGREPEVPDFKEIMDLDFALSLYQKDIDEWKNNEPNNLAAKLTRDKLYNLFPDIQQDVLSQLLMAHDNNFQATVEVLLMSTGRSDILDKKNGINKFVMDKEMERQEKLLEQQRKELSEVEWPLLPPGEKVELSVIENYRDLAEKHLLRRNMHFNKAGELINQGMTEAAVHHSELASYHKERFEESNSLAAVALIQFHASNSPDNATLDLHYLRVGEAVEALDLFIDTHIQKLNETRRNGGTKLRTLYFITGRGKHSRAGPRVKPAVRRRLRDRGFRIRECNPGLLSVKVHPDCNMSHQIE